MSTTPKAVALRLAKALAYFGLPAAAYDWLRTTNPKALLDYHGGGRRVLAGNRELRDRHAGQRCVILCNGPSVNRQALRHLANETVFSVSSGYHYRDYDAIAPRYHCVPGITYGRMTEADVVQWFQEMDARLVAPEIFLHRTERRLVEANGLFPGRKIRYLSFGRAFRDDERAVVDITRPIPGATTVPVMALMIAMYMGFKAIYLVGTEHDSFITGTYQYFYEPTVNRGKDVSVDAEGRVVEPLYNQLVTAAKVWRQYLYLRQIAEANDVMIYNATLGGALDVFERRDIGVLTSAAGSDPAHA